PSSTGSVPRSTSATAARWRVTAGPGSICCATPGWHGSGRPSGRSSLPCSTGKPARATALRAPCRVGGAPTRRWHDPWTEVSGVEAIQASLAAVIRQRPDELLVPGSPTIFATRRQIAAAALQHRIPTVSGYREFVDEGALMTYTDPLPDKFRRAASCVDRILRGAKPADLPIELPTKFELRINLKTAKA